MGHLLLEGGNGDRQEDLGTGISGKMILVKAEAMVTASTRLDRETTRKRPKTKKNTGTR